MTHQENFVGSDYEEELKISTARRMKFRCIGQISYIWDLGIQR